MRLSRLLVLGAFAGVGAAAAAEPLVPPALRARLETGADEIVARSFVPSQERPVGEVRLIRRGDANVVQTLLYSKVLSRVVGEIRTKELANWSEGEGRGEALRYVEALAAVQERLWNRLSTREPTQDRRQKLWIEFLVTPGTAAIAIGAFEMETPGGEVRVVARETLAVLRPSRDYARRNMRLIAEDAFRAHGSALDSLLAPLELLR